METYKDGRGYPTRRYKSSKGAEYELIEVKPGSKRKRSSSASKSKKRANSTKRARKSTSKRAHPRRKATQLSMW